MLGLQSGDFVVQFSAVLLSGWVFSYTSVTKQYNLALWWCVALLIGFGWKVAAGLEEGNSRLLRIVKTCRPISHISVGVGHWSEASQLLKDKQSDFSHKRWQYISLAIRHYRPPSAVSELY